MALTQFIWTEKYRPSTIDDCILPSDTKNTIKSFIAQGDLPNMILSSTNPGIGKTTLALAMCKELNATTMFINGSEESGIDVLRTKIKNFAAALSLDGKRKYVIIDEADFLNPNSTQPALRGLIEEFAINCGFILTCNYNNRIIPALQSRCTNINLEASPEEQKLLKLKTLDRIQYILREENITADEKLIIGAIKRFWPDIRETINEIQLACSDGVLTPRVLGKHNDVQYDSLWNAIKTRNYKDARAWIGQNANIDAASLYRAVFDWLHENADETTLPTLIVLTADYQYKHLSAIDPHVHLAAYVLEIMHNARYK